MSEMNENKKMPCAVARDLMPLYVENLTEEETTAMMREHIAECAACAQSFGMQKTKLEIEKKPQRPDFRGVRFFKKSFLKRVALWMAIAIMSVGILCAGYMYVFENRHIDRDDIRVVGQYELSGGRIVIAVQAEGHAVSNTVRYEHEWTDGRLYEYDQFGNRVVITDQNQRVYADLTLVYDRFDLWTKKEDDRGSTFYYMFDPAAYAMEYEDSYIGFSTPPPTDTTELTTEEKETETTVAQMYLTYLDVNGRVVWRMGDSLRKLTVAEEEVLLRTMEKAGFLDSSKLLPEVDIIDTLMGK